MIKAVIETSGSRVFSYKHAGTVAQQNETMEERIRAECLAADAFFQIIGAGVGTVTINGVPAIEQELNWYFDRFEIDFKKKPRPFIVVVDEPNTSSEEKELLDRYAARSEVKYVENSAEALGLFTSKHQVVKSAHGPAITAIRGHMDREIVEPSIETAFREALFKENHLLPQKFLYTSPFGALFWKRLANANGSSVRQSFDAVKLDSDHVASISKLISTISQWPLDAPISLVALGCGDGRRECNLTEKIVKALPGRRVRVLLVDVSKTLIADAATRFMQLRNDRGINMEIEFALADFERPTTLSTLLYEWEPTHPVALIFLGNTLGNINFASFVGALTSGMKRGDQLLTEVTLVSGSLADFAKKTGRQPIRPQSGDRFQFLTSPIRQLGIAPREENYRVRYSHEDISIRRTYEYKFDQNEAKIVASILGHDRINQSLLLMRVDAFFPNELREAPAGTLRMEDSKIHEYPVAGPIGGTMGLFLASRSN